MSRSVKEELEHIDAELIYIDKILLAIRQAAEEKRRTLHTAHLEFCPDSNLLRERLEIKKVGLGSRRQRVELFKDMPERRATLRAVIGLPAIVDGEP